MLAGDPVPLIKITLVSGHEKLNRLKSLKFIQKNIQKLLRTKYETLT